MAFKLIEVATPADQLKAVVAVAREAGVDDVQIDPAAMEDGRRSVRLVVGEIDRQSLLDRLQGALGTSENWRITMLPVDTVIPLEEPTEEEKSPGEEGEEKRREEQARASREELHNLVAGGVRTDSNFILLVFLSTVVASVGLEKDSVAVLIGAMVIAPLLGPNVAFAFGAAIGERALMFAATKANVLGVTLSIVVAGLIAFVVTPNVASHELMARTSVDYDGIALALASGAAAALSVTTGLSSTLVGVMVAVALLPPAATLGIMVVAGRMDLAIGAGMLLVANVACVNLAAQVIFLTKGIKPRTWFEQQSARKAVLVNLTTWIVLLAILVGVIALRRSGEV